MAVVDYSPEGLAKCNFPGNPLVDEYATGWATDQQPDAGRQPGERLRRSIGAPESCRALLREVPRVRRRRRRRQLRLSAVGVQPARRTRYYACLQNQSGAHSNPVRTRRTVEPSAHRSTNGIIGFMSAIDLTNNTMKWQIRGHGRRAWATATAARSRPPATSCSPGGRADRHAANLPQPGHDPAGRRDAPDAGRAARRVSTPPRARSCGRGASRTTRRSRRRSRTCTRASSTSRPTTAWRSPGFPGATATGQRDQLTVFAL